MIDTKLIVMLTENDRTVPNAIEVLSECKNLSAKYFGIKTEPLSLSEMKRFTDAVHDMDRIAVFESVTYNERKGLADAEKAVFCKCDILLGTKYSDSINEICRKNGIKYMPFIGNPYGVPSILEGSLMDFREDMENTLKNGTYGVDFLALRYNGDSHEMMKNVFSLGIKTEVCIAGSIDSCEKLSEVLAFNPSFITVGSAFFANRFCSTFQQQIEKVLSFIAEYKI